DRAAELADRLLERARAAVRDGAAPGALACGTSRASALVAFGRRRLPLRADRRAADDLLARRRARGRRVGGALDRARLAADREGGGGGPPGGGRGRGGGGGV